MSKKSKKSKCIKTEADVLKYLENVVNKDKDNGVWTQLKGSYLRAIPKHLRTPNVCVYIFQHNDVFNVRIEIPYMSLDSLTEDMLIKAVYNFPSLLSPVDAFGNYKDVYIPEEKQTLALLIAFEIGKRRFETGWQHYEYPLKAYNIINIIRQLAYKVMSSFDGNFVERSFSFDGKNNDEKNLFVEDVIKLIKKEAKEYDTRQNSVVTPADIAKADIKSNVPGSKYNNICDKFNNIKEPIQNDRI